MAILTRVISTVFLALAVTATSLFAQDTSGGDAMGTVLRQAAEKGATVIVVDSAGNIITTETPPSDQEEPEGQSDNANPEDQASMLMEAQTEADHFRNVLQQRLSALPASINEVLFILRASSPDGRISTFGKVVLWALLFLGIGVLFERHVYGKRIASRWVIPRIKQNPLGYTEKLPFLVYRFFAGILGVLISMGVAFLVGVLAFGTAEDTAIQFTYVVVNVAYFCSRAASLMWRMILSPYLSQYRLPVFSDRDAIRLHRWLWVVATIDVCLVMFTLWLDELGLNYDVHALMSAFGAAIVSILNIALVLVNGRAISKALRGGLPIESVSAFSRFLSTAWQPVFVVYVLLSWAKLVFDLVLERETSAPMIVGVYATLISVLLVYGLINYVIERFFNRARAMEAMNAEAAPDEDDFLLQDKHEMRTFEDLAHRVSGVLAIVAGLSAFIEIWGARRMIDQESLVNRGMDIVVILFIGYIVFHAFRIWVDDKIAEEQGDEIEAELGDEGGASSASRLATLLPLFRNFILILIAVSVVLIILLELGINVSPLFAGAGVIGLAIGFGAQTLVRDIFSGAFFLFDDAFRKGEYIDIGSVKGTVEKISVRSFQLRHHLGPLHTIPFGEIQFLTNYSRDWVIMKLPLRVTYDTDVEKVRKLIKKLGIELLDDPVIGDNFIQPLKSQGVVEMQDSAMIIRVKFMTKPGDQWLVRKRVFQEIRDLFEREGIRFAHREVTVRLADEDTENMTPKQREAVAGAVQTAIEEEGLLDEDGGDDR